MTIHIIEKGENVYTISKKYEISPYKLAEINGIQINDTLPIGERLLILQPKKTHNVKVGETLESIARKFEVSESAIMANNPELKGQKSLFQGQLLALKYDLQSYGLGLCNGYFYRGCSMEKLTVAMQYLTYCTVCSARSISSHIEFLFSDGKIVKACNDMGKMPILRIYCINIPFGDNLQNFIDSIITVTKNHGYCGVAIGTDINTTKKEEFKKFIFLLRKGLIDSNLLLFTEADAEEEFGYTEYSDFSVLTYDKCDKNPIPSFADGEEFNFRNFADNADSSKTFIDISPFALSNRKYLEKSAIWNSASKNHLVLNYNSDSMTISIDGPRNRKTVYESLENTHRKYELISELGYLGISFDIMRTQIRDLLMFRNMFCPTFSSKLKSF